jgi:predicted PurR-regulated permease PerM
MQDDCEDRVEPTHALIRKAIVLFAVALGGGVLIYVLVAARTAFVLIAVSAFLAAALNHPVEWLCRRGLARGLAIAAVMAVVLGVLLGAVVLLVPAVVRQGEQFVQRAPTILRQVQDSPLYHTLEERFALSSQLEKLEGEIPGMLQRSVNPALKALTSVFAVAAGLLTIFFLTVFMLVFGGRLVNALLQEATPARRVRYRRVLVKVYHSVGGYLAGISFICLVNATLTTIMLAILRVPFFLPLGLLSGTSSLVPYAGPALMGTTVTLIALATVGLWKGVAVAVFYILYGQLEGHLLAPLVFRRTVNVNPLVSIMSLVIFGELAGIPGAIAAVPLAAIGQIVLREILLLRRERLHLPLTGEAGSIDELPHREIKKLAEEDAAHKEAEQSSASH